MADPTRAVAILQELFDHKEDLSTAAVESLLSELKIYSRDLQIIKQAFDEKAIKFLAEYGLRRYHSKEALRCLANALLQVQERRQIVVDAGYAVDASNSLKSCDEQTQFLLCRLLFLLTYNTTLDFEALDKKTGLCRTITDLLREHASSLATRDTLALDEVLKLLFNITHFFPGLINTCTDAVQPISKLLVDVPLPSKPLQAPIGSLINALLNLNLKDAVKQADTSNIDVPVVIERLVQVLDMATKSYSNQELDSAANPLLTLLRRIGDIGGNPVRTLLGTKLLPQERDRSKPLGEGDTLPARLLRLSVSPDLPMLGDNISALFFELSSKDSEQLVHNIGYGYASGYLLKHGMTASLPDQVGSQAKSDSINPVTGQHLASEPKSDDPFKGMSEEEKEQEAERLFVLFERLKATGVIDVKNPVERLYREDG